MEGLTVSLPWVWRYGGFDCKSTLGVRYGGFDCKSTLGVNMFDCKSTLGVSM